MDVCKSNHLSITVSNANDLNSANTEELINQVWNEISKYIKKKIIYESVQIVREKKQLMCNLQIILT